MIQLSKAKERKGMKKTLGMMIAELRKEKGMTQLELAEKMGVTDKAVSKWERDLSCPDINSLPNLADILGVTVDELMQIKKEAENPSQSVQDIIQLIFKAVPMAMGVAVVVLSVMGELEIQTGFTMLGLGMCCIGISLLNNKEK
jgi:transcriptional regulator with XRE-family HTH domain